MFINDVGTMQIPIIIDAVIAYDCPDTTKVWLLIVCNVLFVESMNHNLIPPFILQEGGMEVIMTDQRYTILKGHLHLLITHLVVLSTGS